MAQDKEPLISLRKAHIKGGEDTVLYDVDMEIYPGDFVYIVGKVGSGKTSIIKTFIAEYPLEEGRCEVCGFRVHNIRSRDIPALRRKCGVVFQDFMLLTDRSVHDNLEFVLKATGWKDTSAIEKRISEVLEAVGMETKDHKMPHQLSGGEQQRIAIARAILNRPEVILADEPTGNLDAETAGGIMKLFQKINESEGTAVVIVTHDRHIFENYPGRVFVCADERCRELKSPGEVIDLSITI
ncbi:MAG: ATP-binding cassette domain-containing protein [Bacteroidales bacterium]|nr:ATP-binding cassette domain-containing protein [Bacteroidales bacterium]